MKQENLSTSSSDWNKFLKRLIGITISALALLYLWVYLVDAYDIFLFSADASRSPVSSKRRHFNPGIARNPSFDSFIMGTSTVMLLKPQHLNQLLDAKIANLSLPAGSPYEQLRMAALFMEYHEKLNLIILSVDDVWCSIDGADKYIDVNNKGLVEERQLQEWRYGSSFWQQLPPLNRRIIKDTRRQLSNILGFRSFPYDADGYADFTRQFAEEWDQDEIHKNLYGTAETKIKQSLQAAVKVTEAEIKSWKFPDLIKLKNWLSSLPSSARKILLFPPHHYYGQAQAGSKNELSWNECKKRVTDMGQTVPQLTVVDFMFKSSITTNDNNYWDPMHYSVAIADKIEQTLGDIVMKQPMDDKTYTIDPYFKILTQPPSGLKPK